MQNEGDPTSPAILLLPSGGPGVEVQGRAGSGAAARFTISGESSCFTRDGCGRLAMGTPSPRRVDQPEACSISEAVPEGGHANHVLLRNCARMRMCVRMLMCTA